jgi:hypothetical protein
VGEYIDNLLSKSGAAEPRFALSGKSTVQARNVY